MSNPLRPAASKRSMHNPFAAESPEALDPGEIVDQFVGDFTPVRDIARRTHTFVWGVRGSGKSMLLRYLEPQCQAIVHGTLRDFLASAGAFVAVYCRCKEGYFNKTELQLLDGPTSRIISEHMLNMHIAGRLTGCLKQQSSALDLGRDELRSFAQRVMRFFDPASIAASLDAANKGVDVDVDPLGWLAMVFESEDRKLNDFLRVGVLRPERRLYTGATTGYHDFLLPLARTIRDLPPFGDAPLYVMLDDAQRLTRDQQMLVNTWIANRDQADICFKIASEPNGYKTFRTAGSLYGPVAYGDRDESVGRGGSLEPRRDYFEVNIDEVYTANRSQYAGMVARIADRRLDLAGIRTARIRDVLPPAADEDPRSQRIVTPLHDEQPSEPQPVEAKRDIRARAELIDSHRSEDRHVTYAGFDTIVDVSSEIVRSFLEPAYLMFEQQYAPVGDGSAGDGSAGDAPRPAPVIPPDLQNRVLREYAGEFLNLVPEKIRNDLGSDDRATLRQLETLLRSLGGLFDRLRSNPIPHDHGLYAFTVLGSIPHGLEDVLTLGVRYTYLQPRRFFIPSEFALGKWYALNRRLCPAFELDPGAPEGKLEFTVAALELACTDSAAFLHEPVSPHGDSPEVLVVGVHQGEHLT